MAPGTTFGRWLLPSNPELFGLCCTLIGKATLILADRAHRHAERQRDARRDIQTMRRVERGQPLLAIDVVIVEDVRAAAERAGAFLELIVANEDDR